MPEEIMESEEDGSEDETEIIEEHNEMLEEIEILSLSPTVSETSGIVPFAVDDGNIYFNTATGIITLADKSITSADIPDTIDGVEVVSIGDNAFGSCKFLTELILPDTLTTIGYQAFMNCTALTNVTIPASVTKTGYYYGTTNPGQWFRGCSSLKEITLEEGATVIPAGAFADIPAAFSIAIPDTVEIIGNEVFRNSSIIKVISAKGGISGGEGVVIIPASVSTAGTRIFADCRKLTTIEWPDSLANIPDSTFSGCTALTSITLPSTLTTIGYQAFINCTALTNVTIPASVTKTGYYYGTTNPGQWFRGCSSLKEITLEEGATVIPAGAFADIPAAFSIAIPDTVENIGNEAFRDCKNVTSIELPFSITTVGKNAFSNCSALTLRFPLNFTLLEYVFANKLKYEVIVGNMYMSQGILNDSESYYLSDELSAEGYLICKLNYSVNEGDFEGVSNSKIRIRFSDSAELVYGSLMLNGEKCMNYTYRDQLISIPVSECEGSVQFVVRPIESQSFTSFASLNYTKDEKRYDDMIGYMNTQLPTLSLDVVPVTSFKKFDVNGISLPGSNVSVYFNDFLMGSAVTASNGKYKIPVTLNVSEKTTYAVTASAASGSKVIATADSEVKYDPSHPEIMSFIMNYQVHSKPYSLDLLAIQGQNATYLQDPKTPIVYSLKFANDDDVEKIYVRSTKNGEVLSLEAKRDDSAGVWVTSGFFNPADTAYSPGTLTVHYQTAFGSLKESFYELDASDKRKVLNAAEDHIKKAATGLVTSGDLPFPSSVEAIFAVIDKMDKANTAADILNAVKQIYNSGEELSDQQNIELCRTLISVTKHLSAKIIPNQPFLMFFLEVQLRTIDMYEYILAELNEVDRYLEEMLATGDYSNLPNVMKKLENIMNTIYSYASMDEETINRLKEELDEDSSEETTGEEYDTPDPIRDPSGYVYEAVTSNRLSGAEVRVYYEDDISGIAIFWNAAPYGQENGQITDEDGIFGWNVPDGNWQLRCFMDGYQTYVGGWLTVPPQHFDIGINMISYEIPELEFIAASDSYLELTFSKYMRPDTIGNITVTDSAGEQISYNLEYASNEKDTNGTVYAKTYRVRLAENAGAPYTLHFTEQICSYANVPMIEHNMILP